MSQEDGENNDTKPVVSNSLILKIFNIFLLLVLLAIIGVFLFVFISISSGGNPNIDFSEVNETMAAYITSYRPGVSDISKIERGN